MSAEPLRIALAGAGTMAQHHARAVARLGDQARLVGIIDPLPAARDRVRAAIPGVATFDTLAAALATGSIDVVHVCTPPAAHAATARAAIAAGCHVYVEKPFAETAADAETVLAEAAARGVKVCAGHQLLYEAPARRAVPLVPALGRLVHVESFFSFRTVRRAPGGHAPLRADLQLLDILPHPVYLLLHFLDLAGPGETRLAALELGAAGTVHALLRRGSLTGHLVVTLEGRPVESYIRLVGTTGSLHADFVRGTVQRLIGPGTSGIDKLLAPYRLSWQTGVGTTAALGKRFLRKQRSYPGLAELFEAFYTAIRTGGPSPVSPASILETVRVCGHVSAALRSAAESQTAAPLAPVTATRAGGRRVVVSGGTGFLGKAVARTLAARGHEVLVLARREPAPWERLPGVGYAVADLGVGLPPDLLRGADAVIHAAAETAGGWDDHQRNSLDATEHVIRAAAVAGVKRILHVSSLAVLARAPIIGQDTPLEPDSRSAGPYVWGKLESERLALRLGKELGVSVKIVRPGAIVDYDAFEAPGRLGRQVGPLFVAVGSPRERLGVVDLAFTAATVAWMVERFEDAPAALNLLAPELPTKRELVDRLRRGNPDLVVAWLPTVLLVPLSWTATALQRVLRPRVPPISLRKVFAAQRYDTSAVRALAGRATGGA